MSDMQSKIEQIIFDKVDPRHSEEVAAAQAIIAALPDMVKPLVFSGRSERLPDGAHLAADCAFGLYYVCDRGRYGVGWKRAGSYVFQSFEDTEDGAISMAQEDYQRRIMSAFGLGGEE